MAKVTRIAYSKNLNSGKLDQLREIASRLGNLRQEVWHRYGSIAGVVLTHRQIRNLWLAEGRKFDLPARLWKETLRDTFDDICLYLEAAKARVRKAIPKRTTSELERKRLFTLLKEDRWTEDNYLRRMMRKYFKHGHTKVKNQIILDKQCYSVFELNGQAWIEVMSLQWGKRIAIPLDTNRSPSGTLRLILRNGVVEVHYTVDSLECSTRPCGDKEVGIDKGYTEVCFDSDEKSYGEGLGELLSAESDVLKVKYQRRNKLKAITEAKADKADKAKNIKNTIENNLGRQKLNKRKDKHTAVVRDKIFKAVHALVDSACVIVCEDLSFQVKSKSKKRYSKNQKRCLAGWVKGIIKEALENVSQRRGSTLVYVNAAYTSQMDSRYGVLLGQRKGKKFYCFDGVVLGAEVNAARNILARKDDLEIRLWTPYEKVKSILLERTEQFKSGWDCSSKTLVAMGQLLLFPLSTESELPLDKFE